jgi:endoglucanase
VIVAYEPDSLTQSDGLSADARTGRISMMTWGIQQIKSQCPNALLYVDIGHSAWKTVDQAASLLQEVHVENANGFAINISNFRPDAELITYGQAICGKLNLPNVRFMFDSGRNGNPNIPSWRWANPADTRFGRIPQYGNTGIDKCDGWTWWKRPGESDGNAGDGAPNAGEFWPTYMYNDAKGDNVGTDPNNDLVSATSGLLQRAPTPGVSVTG